jgi:hypothetical protein
VEEEDGVDLDGGCEVEEEDGVESDGGVKWKKWMVLGLGR